MRQAIAKKVSTRIMSSDNVSLFVDAFNRECPLSHQVFARHPPTGMEESAQQLATHPRTVDCLQPIETMARGI